MSFIVEGNNEKLWQVRSSTYDELYEELYPVLKEIAPEIAEKFEETFENRSGHVDLTGFLETEENKNVFINSVNEAITKLKEKGSSHWHDPSGFEPFLKKVEELKQII